MLHATSLPTRFFKVLCINSLCTIQQSVISYCINPECSNPQNSGTPLFFDILSWLKHKRFPSINQTN
ncbi:4-Cys prefix domain-containing protein [Dapis sp. BLCC M229]|uniref:4-Cys prefix domain-containing protein n=1 Tax=Dapis sp. BLCC M229 TaxID=3400188 RepID=UPI003CFB88B3